MQKSRMFLICLMGSLALFFAVVIARAAPVEFNSLDGKTRLRASLLLPDTEPPHRAVVFLHGCSGIGLGGGISATYSSWAHHFNRQGYAVLVVDSAGSRGFASTCGGGERRRIMYAERPGDAYSALRYPPGTAVHSSRSHRPHGMVARWRHHTAHRRIAKHRTTIAAAGA